MERINRMNDLRKIFSNRDILGIIRNGLLIAAIAQLIVWIGTHF